MEAYRETNFFLAKIVQEEAWLMSTIPNIIYPLLKEFMDIYSEEFTSELPLLRNNQHCIDLTPRASLPNLSHYKLNPTKQQILKEIMV